MPADVEPRAALAALAAGAALIDVREPLEWAQVRIPGAVLIPLAQVADRITEIPADRDVYVHCHSGVRSGHAVDFLVANGRPRARNVAGGIVRWAQDGLPFEQAPG